LKRRCYELLPSIACNINLCLYVKGEMWRFCNVCYVLHRASGFRKNNKTCNAVRRCRLTPVHTRNKTSLAIAYLTQRRCELLRRLIAYYSVESAWFRNVKL